ncbi:hypothetical protein CRG98_019486 [Punica granatum]|uniref:PB1-like domain-containing protein n=1 Tax=Punica granatum TaxID=22663 RepID=A0A2I0JV57_PUNGR|nr:hypothetical protein CRG98_019486 [Punica granatum]
MDIDKVSIPVIQELFEKHGYKKYNRLYWLQHGFALEDGLIVLKTDDDVRKLYVVATTGIVNEFEFYFVHDLEDTPNGGAKVARANCGDQNDVVGRYDDKDDAMGKSDDQNDARGLEHVQEGDTTDVARKEAGDSFFDQLEYHSEELESLKGSEGEKDERKPLVFNQNAPYGQVHLELEMISPTLKLFKIAVKDYNIALGKPVKKKKNDKKRCKFIFDKGCPWEVFCSWSEPFGGYQIKTFNPNHAFSRKLKIPLADRK